MRYVETRQDLLAELPKDSIGAEIGVQRGDFSQDIQRIVKPRELHLVDCWKAQSGGYEMDPANIDQAGQEENYKCVQARREFYPNWHILRNFSTYAEAYFAKDSLHWVYLDADHSRDQVRADLFLWSQKIKPGGKLMGHDYVHNGKSLKMGFGVVESVDRFCLVHGWRIEALTLEEWSSYCLVRI